MDDETVVVGGVMTQSMSVATYLRTPETLRRRELRYGVVRDAAAPTFFHQRVVSRLYRALAEFAEPTLGIVAVAPVDVVLDRQRSLVVQPDILFVSAQRAAICDDQVWGAPDLTVEVLSPRTYSLDLREKTEWYRQYGVRECWLVDPLECWIETQDLQQVGCARRFAEDQVLQSNVMPGLRIPVGAVLAPGTSAGR